MSDSQGRDQVSPQNLLIPAGWLQTYNSLLGWTICGVPYGPGDHRPVTYQAPISPLQVGWGAPPMGEF